MVIKDIDSKLIVAKFAMHGFNIHPHAVELLRNTPIDDLKLDQFIEKACKMLDGCLIVTPDEISRILDKIQGQSMNPVDHSEKKIGALYDVNNSINNRIPVVSKSEKKSGFELTSELTRKSGIGVEKTLTDGITGGKTDKDLNIRVIRDITGHSTCEGGISDFVVHFNSRFEKISKFLKRRISAVPIKSAPKLKSEKVEIVGIVCDVRETVNGNYIIELEDNSGRISVIATGRLKEIATELLGDEVIGVSGNLRGRFIIADRIIFPDIPQNGRKIEKDFSLVFISDIHFGSNTFLKKEWNTFIKWLNCEIGNEYMQNLAESVKCISIAGDVVDGVGIYPDQDKELEIYDIYQQYEEAAFQLDRIPKRIKIILSPGNHDAVRQAEPQPSLPKEFAELFSSNVINVGNPAYIDVDGVNVLIYHGRSFDDIITKISRLSYSDPVRAMEEILKRRHLAPMYGGRSPLAPEKEDFLVIDEIPDILHTGHIHTYGTGFYRGVMVVNSSTWQSQTEFQKKVNLNPMPGNVAIYKPGGKIHRLRFYKENQ
jgi:DNA polymerase II small subunit